MALGLGILLAVVAVLLIVRGIWGLRRLDLISSWPAVDATVIAPALDEFPPIDGGPTHRPKLTYSYTIEGKTYRSSRLGIAPDAFDIFSQDLAHAFVARYPPGSRVEIRVSPTDPLFSVVDEGASSRKRNHFLTLVVSGSLLICCIVAVTYVA
jgi:hypothetical protein